MSKEIFRFPHAILEVKLQTQAGQEAPSWVERLISGPLVEEVPKFSKYIHGCASLFPSSTTTVPYWFQQMDTDIRKGPGHEPGGSAGSLSDSDADKAEASGITIINIGPGGDDDDINTTSTTLNTAGETLPLLPRSAPRTSMAPSPAAPSRLARAPHAPSSGNNTGDKRIHIPVRVEPKVFFANERTFLSWVHFSIFLGGISTALVGFGNRNAKISGYLFAFISILFTLYALYLYQWRAERIRQRDPGPYDDRIGPNVVVIIFVLAMIANIVFTASAGI
jgi:uncharacterized membrane protein YidH (DUF202 family)